MSEPTSPDSTPPERLHPLFLLSGIGTSLRQLAGGYAILGYLVVSGRLGTAFAVALVLVAVSLVGSFLYWRSFQFRVGADEIRIDSGIFNRTHRSIPFDRVQDVDIAQGAVARLLGIASVSFETGGASEGARDEGVLRAVPLERAEEIRRIVRGHRPEVASPADAEAAQPPVYAMDLPRVWLAGLFNFSLAIFAGLLGLTQTLGDVMGFDPFEESFWRNLLSAGSPIADLILAHRAVAIVAGAVLLLIAGAATGLVRTLLRDFGFRLDRTESSLRRRRGLFTRTDVSLPLRRVQAALVSTGPLRDAFGWWELKLQNLAQDEGHGDHVVAPLATEEEVERIVRQIGWRPVSGGVRWTLVSRAYVWIFLLRLVPVLLIILFAILAGTAWSPDPTVAGAWLPLLALVAILGVAVLARLLAWRRTAYALDGDRLLVRTGWWKRRLRILPVDKVQSIELAQSFVSRWFGVSNMIFGVAGGHGFSAHSIPAVPHERACQLRSSLLDSEA